LGSGADITRLLSNVRFIPDCVAKLFTPLRRGNYRIQLNAVLNQCCAPVLVLESILLNLVAKIVLQHNLPQSGQSADMLACPLCADCVAKVAVEETEKVGRQRHHYFDVEVQEEICAKQNSKSQDQSSAQKWLAQNRKQQISLRTRIHGSLGPDCKEGPSSKDNNR
jgi:hypothetical protein